jgi:hypothetical protein
MPRNIETTRLGREAFLAKFGGDRAALAEHMAGIRRREARLTALGKKFEEILAIMGYESKRVEMT